MEKENKQIKKEQIIIDGSFVPFGRLGAFAAKKALKGNNVVIINTDKIIIIGRPKLIIEEYAQKRRLGKGNPRKPIFCRDVIPMFKRSIRGMIGFKKTTGQEALKRIMCYIGIPKEFEGKETVKLEQKFPLNYVTLDEISKSFKN
ncbi:50S ribosomal protein L13 [Candidatus Pacearchaeota archaeon]|nr:50S ribosomal protein L13 [Candidatus Pacearchaeota archaeon]